MSDTHPKDPSGGRRTIVVSDAHGHVELIDNALADARFDSAHDFLVYAGDLVDGGSRIKGGEDCLERLQANGALILWGNHDVAALLDYSIDGQDRDTRPHFTKRFAPYFHGDGVDRWRLAACVQGVLITHGGVSSDYQHDFDGDGDGNGGRRRDPYALVERINAEFDAAAERQQADRRAGQSGASHEQAGAASLSPARRRDVARPRAEWSDAGRRPLAVRALPP